MLWVLAPGALLIQVYIQGINIHRNSWTPEHIHQEMKAKGLLGSSDKHFNLTGV
jgi:hypothetical protein